MIIQLNTDNNIQYSADLENFISEHLKNGLKQHVDRISRAEVHLSDQNADKGGADDILCKIEVRVEGMDPMLADSKDENKEKAIDSAVSKVKARLDTALGKLQDR